MAQMPSIPEDLFLGQVLKGLYRIDAKIDEGGMGAVYRATQLMLDRTVAVKTLVGLQSAPPEQASRFMRDAQILSRLNHPHVVSLLDFDSTDEGILYFVMEYLEGKSLEAFVEPMQGLPTDLALNLMQQALYGVGAAHREHLVHRNLSPSSIFVADPDGSPTVKILVFGLARSMDEGDNEPLDAPVVGSSPSYLSPEHFHEFGLVNEKSDIYALGAILYFMIAGRPAFPDKSSPEVMADGPWAGPPPIDFAGLGKPEAAVLEPLIHRAMALDPEQRFPSAEAFNQAIRAACHLPERRVKHEVRLLDSGGPAELQSPLDSPIRPDPIPPHVGERSMSKNLVIGVLVALLLAVGGLTYLAMGGHSFRSAAAGPVAQVQGVSATELKLGMSAAFSGPSKELGVAMKTGIECCLRAINEGGGIHGRSINLVALDDGYEPDRALANMKDLYERRDVFGFIGNVGTPTAQVSLPYALEKKAMFFGAFTGAPLLRKEPPDRYVFNYRASYEEETGVLVRYMVTLKRILPQEIAVFAQQDGYGDAGFNGVAKTMRKFGRSGDQILRVGYQRNTLDVDDAVQRIMSSPTRIRGIVMVGTYRPTARFIQKMKDRGASPLFASVSFVGSEALADELKNLGPSYADGVVVSQVVPHPESQASLVIKYREALKKYFPEQQPSFGSLEGYVATNLFVEGVRKAGKNLNGDTLVEALESIQNLDLGTGTTLSFGPSQHQGSHKVWGTMLDGNAHFQTIDLE